MNLREVLGLVLLIAGIMLFPFGYWMNVKWYFIALLPVFMGGALFFSERLSRRLSSSSIIESHIDPPVLTKELRGFPGAKIETHETLDVTGDVDGD
jgi:hypothetical protein